MRKLTVDIIEEFISNLELTGVITSVQYSAVDDATSVILNNELYHLRKNMSVNVEGVGDFKVTGIDRELFTFTVEGDQTSTIFKNLKVTIPVPFYFHGTPQMTNNHISNLSSDAQAPMVYLREVLREVTPAADSPFARVADLRLFFIDDANLQDWMTDAHYSERLKGLNDLVDKFIDELRADGNTFEAFDVDFERYNRPNWGEYADLKGYEKTIFSGDYTSVEVNCSLPILKNEMCYY